MIPQEITLNADAIGNPIEHYEVDADVRQGLLLNAGVPAAGSVLAILIGLLIDNSIVTITLLTLGGFGIARAAISLLDLYMVWGVTFTLASGGVAHARGDRPHMLPWESVEQIRARRAGLIREVSLITLWKQGGGRLVLIGMPDFQFGQHVQQVHANWLAPRIQEQLEGGQAVAFGNITLGPTGIHSPEGTWAWESISRAEVVGSRLSLTVDGQMRTLAVIQQIPNPYVLAAVIAHRLQQGAAE